MACACTSTAFPATGPDGQGQVSHFDIAGAERVEVLRGPFSVLYGNSSGGVIALFSAPATRSEIEAGVDIGSFGLRQGRVGASLVLGQGLDVQARLSQADDRRFPAAERGAQAPGECAPRLAGRAATP